MKAKETNASKNKYEFELNRIQTTRNKQLFYGVYAFDERPGWRMCVCVVDGLAAWAHR